jgi:hypothetical protein
MNTSPKTVKFDKNSLWVSLSVSMNFRRHWRNALLLLLWTVCASAMGYSTFTERWSEDALLSDERVIKVEREALKVVYREYEWTLFPRRQGNHWIRFKHPDTQETITWKSEGGYVPVLLDFVNGVPWLVVLGRSRKDTEAIYGCPELPYIYLKYESGFFGKWLPVPLEKAPDGLRQANLTPGFPDFGGDSLVGVAHDYLDRHGRDTRDLSSAEIQKKMSSDRSSWFQRVIPRTYDEWNYGYKDSYLNQRQTGDCRPPRKPPPPMTLPAAVESSPEILNAIDYTPDRIVVQDDWTTMVFDKERGENCTKLFKPADPNDYMKGQRFIKDNTGNKPVPYSRTTQFDMGANVLCDEHIWFVTHQEEPGKIIISKFTVTGDLVYRTSFRKPDPVAGFVGYIRTPSFRSQDGYLYFDWLDFRDTYRVMNHEWHIKRWLELRIREPEVPNPALEGTLDDKAAQSS